MKKKVLQYLLAFRPKTTTISFQSHYRNK